MAGPTNGPARSGLPAQRQQVFVGGGLATGAAVAGRATTNELGKGVRGVVAAGPSVASGALGASAAEVQLDGAAERMGDGCGIYLACGVGEVVPALDALRVRALRLGA